MTKPCCRVSERCSSCLSRSGAERRQRVTGAVNVAEKEDFSREQCI